MTDELSRVPDYKRLIEQPAAPAGGASDQSSALATANAALVEARREIAAAKKLVLSVTGHGVHLRDDHDKRDCNWCKLWEILKGRWGGRLSSSEPREQRDNEKERLHGAVTPEHHKLIECERIMNDQQIELDRLNKLVSIEYVERLIKERDAAREELALFRTAEPYRKLEAELAEKEKELAALKAPDAELEALLTDIEVQPAYKIEERKAAIRAHVNGRRARIKNLDPWKAKYEKLAQLVERRGFIVTEEHGLEVRLVDDDIAARRNELAAERQKVELMTKAVDDWIDYAAPIAVIHGFHMKKLRDNVAAAAALREKG